jgi:uncharacterized protein (DUF2126 family)
MGTNSTPMGRMDRQAVTAGIQMALTDQRGKKGLCDTRMAVGGLGPSMVSIGGQTVRSALAMATGPEERQTADSFLEQSEA